MTNIIKKLNIFKKGPAQYRACSGSGFAILFAVTLSSIVLAIALGVANIALREVKFSTSTKFTNEAFFAADTGIECAFFNDRSTSNTFLDPNGSGFVSCLGQTDIPVAGNFSEGWSFILSGLGNSAQGCAKVSVVKVTDGSTGAVTTTIFSKGYNIGDESCNSDNPNRIEREIKTTY